MKNLFLRFVKDEAGVTAMEYGLIAALIAVVIITAVQLVGTNLTATFNTVAGHLGAGHGSGLTEEPQDRAFVDRAKQARRPRREGSPVRVGLPRWAVGN